MFKSQQVEEFRVNVHYVHYVHIQSEVLGHQIVDSWQSSVGGWRSGPQDGRSVPRGVAPFEDIQTWSLCTRGHEDGAADRSDLLLGGHRQPPAQQWHVSTYCNLCSAGTTVIEY